MAEILYQGHGSFRLKTQNGAVIYIDPYAGKGYDLPADAALVTHEHGDHNRTDLLTLAEGAVILRASDMLKNGEYLTKELCGVRVTAVPACNRNHPADRCVGYVVETDGKKIYFAGDTSKTEAMGSLLKSLMLDAAFYPCDGVYNMNAEEASLCASLVGAAASFPVHTCPGKLFDEEVAAAFDCPGKKILRPGETLFL